MTQHLCVIPWIVKCWFINLGHLLKYRTQRHPHTQHSKRVESRFQDRAGTGGAPEQSPENKNNRVGPGQRSAAKEVRVCCVCVCLCLCLFHKKQKRKTRRSSRTTTGVCVNTTRLGFAVPDTTAVAARSAAAAATAIPVFVSSAVPNRTTILGFDLPLRDSTQSTR